MSAQNWLTVGEVAAKLRKKDGTTYTLQATLRLLKQVQADNPGRKLMERRGPCGQWKINPIEVRRIIVCETDSPHENAFLQRGIVLRLRQLERETAALKAAMQRHGIRLTP